MNYDILKNCRLCPRNCGVNRQSGKIGFCGSNSRIKIARAALHFWEEPCISGKSGSGAIFFSHCTLKCVFCQNYGISTQNHGKYISESDLSDIFLHLQDQGANNINLVTPTHYVPQIINALCTARKNGLQIPIVYNTSGFEKPETIRLLSNYIDVYLPDLKYFDDRYAVKYSNAADYFKTASAAIAEMYRQTGPCVFDESGIIQKGVIVRHLMLPGLLFDTKKIIDYLHSEYGNNIFMSIMSQYTPLDTVPNKFPELKRKLSKKHYAAILDYAAGLGIENAFIQEGDPASESFIPDFYEDDN
ncbi:MAG: radical SAM protein [Firmicutes bacterium]|nr:radical SAM protein [Bacillota bacterium]